MLFLLVVSLIFNWEASNQAVIGVTGRPTMLSSAAWVATFLNASLRSSFLLAPPAQPGLL